MTPLWDWPLAMRQYEAEVDEEVAAHLARRRAGVAHPVEDFLFTYYSYRPAQLRRWHPGFGVLVPSDAPHRSWRGYRAFDGYIGADAMAPPERVVIQIRRLLAATAARPAATACFGLHEWAMVYRAGSVRHAGHPLRLGEDGTARVVESLHLACTHYDAFRFFTPQAAPRNRRQLTRDDQIEFEQPGCLHANMDLYKWAYKLAPLTPSSLVLACFRLARRVRELDMRASPYDLTGLGYEPVRIEGPHGRAEYATLQRRFAAEGAVHRAALIAVCDQVLAARCQAAPDRAEACGTGPAATEASPPDAAAQRSGHP